MRKEKAGGGSDAGEEKRPNGSDHGRVPPRACRLRAAPSDPGPAPGHPAVGQRGQLRQEAAGRTDGGAGFALPPPRRADLRAERLRKASDGAAGDRLHRRRPRRLRHARGFEARRLLAPSVALRLELRRAGRVQDPDAGAHRTRRRPRRSGVGARKGVRCSEAVVAFRGTIQGNKGDWESNFHWILRALPIYDQYDQVRDHIGDFIGHIERDKCYRAGPTQITAVWHSLGGGLAQLAAYADPRIRRVYAFDPSMVTGYYSVNPANRDENVKGLRMERVFEHGEILAYGRYIMRQFIPPSPCNPRVVSIRFNVIHGSPIAQHSLTDFDNALLREARGHQPEAFPMVDEPCGGEAPGKPLVAKQ